MSRARRQFPHARMTVAQAMELRQAVEDELRNDFSGDARIGATISDGFDTFMHDLAEWLTGQGWVEDFPERYQEE